MRRKLYLLLGLLFVIVSTVSIPAKTAHATSAYDYSYQQATSLQTSSSVSGYSCNPVDITSNWASYLLDSSKWRSGANWSAGAASLRSALSNPNASWGVYQFNNGTTDQVEFFWTEDTTAKLDWTTDGVNIATTNSGSNIHLASVSCEKWMYGTGGDNPVVYGVWTLPSYSVSTPTTASLGYTKKILFTHNFDTNYPSGYAGLYVNTTSNAPTAIKGDIQCFNGPTPTITNVHVTPSVGAADNADLSSDGSGGMFYSYIPSETATSYSLNIDCGGITMPAGPVDPAVDNYLWYCSTAVSSECYLQ
jgi:hypothetical protein